MSEPINGLHQTRKNIKTGNLTFLSQQVSAWQKLTKLIQPLLPQPEQWHVACYQNGILTITGLNQAMISQLAYLQKQYITQLSQLEGLHDLQKIYVRLRVEPLKPQKNEVMPKVLNAETQEMLKSAADCVTDPKLSQALLRLASNKK